MAKAKSKTPAKSSRAPGAKTVKARAGIDHKQQAALYKGGSLAQRNDAESRIGPEADRPDEITSAAPPNAKNLNEPGRASSPMFDETPVTGKGATSIPGAPLPEATNQKIKAGEAEDEGKVADVHALEDLPPGSSVEIRASEVVIHAAIAGGSRTTFIGATAKAALKAYNDFAENGPTLVASGRTPEEEKEFQDQLKHSVEAATKRAADAEAEKKKAEA